MVAYAENLEPDSEGQKLNTTAEFSSLSFGRVK